MTAPPDSGVPRCGSTDPGPADPTDPAHARPPLTRREAAQREAERLARVRSLDEQIGDALRDWEARGDLRRAPSWGRALRDDDGFAETPVELRMPFKILKDAGLAPPEVELMREITALEATLSAASADDERTVLRQRIADKRQHLALRMERLRLSRDR